MIISGIRTYKTEGRALAYARILRRKFDGWRFVTVPAPLPGHGFGYVIAAYAPASSRPAFVGR